MTASLFVADDLAGFLGQPVSDERAEAVERVVWGWLSPALGIAERPDPIPAEVYSWAVELAAIAHENPAGLSSYQLGAEVTGFHAERRAEILADASDWAGASGPSRLAPRASFPLPRPLADRTGWW